jgi:hypothetical protein
MIRPLDDLVLLKEIDEVSGIDYTSSSLRKKFPNKIVVIRHIAYIKKDVLCEIALNQVTDLTHYVQLGELAEQISIRKKILLDKIYYMEKTKQFGSGMPLFDYIQIGNIYFIKLTEEFKYKLQNYQPFLATYNDVENVVCGDVLGDLKIGFY